MEFADFYKASWGPCLKAVAASWPEPRLAEDLLAEAFARAWASWREVSRHPAPRAWVVRTALNAGRSWWRRHRREVALADQEPRVAPDNGSALDAGLLEAVRRLPLREREVVALRLILDLDTETTAKQLGIAPGTVRAHLSRAVMTLRQETALIDTVENRECTTTTK
jgi:RNA polymerase sigma factor (sigma-70 family)